MVKKTSFSLLVFFLLFNLFAKIHANEGITTLEGINFQYPQGNKNQVNVVISADKNFDYKTFKLAANKTANKSARYVIDAYNSKPKFYIDDDFQRIFEKDSVINLIRVGKNHKEFTRIVFDLKQAVNAQVTEQSSRSGGHLFIISFTPTNPQLVEKETADKVEVSQEKLSTLITPEGVVNITNDEEAIQGNVTSPQAVAITQVNSENNGIFTIVIDPGHGGRDPGAVTKDGRIKEKDVNYSVAQKLKRYINNDSNFQAFLTREADVLISLGKRIKISHDKKADIFISLHVDSFEDNEKIDGASVFVLADKSASNQIARLLAEKENEVDKKYNLQGLDEIKDKDTQFIVRDIQRKSIDQASEKLATSVLGELAKVKTLFAPFPRKGPFIVLKSSYVPSVLIELGYITNKKEIQSLVQDKEQEKIAEAIYLGIKDYASNNLILSTVKKQKINVSSRDNDKPLKTVIYEVKREDTFKSIARKFRTNEQTIKQLNPKYQDLIFPGDKLTLPAPN